MTATQTSIRSRGLRILVALMLAVASMGVGIPAAQAAYTNQCGSGDTGSQSWHTGSVSRWTAGSTNSNIIWSFGSISGCTGVLPGGAGANISMRVSFCSGGGGTSVGNTWTSAAANYLATSVLPGTCFKVQWRPNNAATDFAFFRGIVTWQIS